MEDIIRQGEDRPPNWRRRVLWIAAAAVAVGLVIAEHIPHGAAPHHPSAHSKLRLGVRISSQLGVITPATLPTNGIPGNVAPWPASARIPRTGTQPDWFWPAKGRVAPILGLPHNRNGYVFTRVVGGWAIQVSQAGQAGQVGCDDCTSSVLATGPAGCSDCSGPAAPVFYLPDQGRRATLVGRANLVAPGAARGAVWLTRYPADAHVARTAGVAQQFSGAGSALGGPVQLPVGYEIAQATSRGLLLVPLSTGGKIITYRLWNPATGKVAAFQGVVAVSATQLAYEPPCQVICPVHVLNLSTGHETVIALPPADMVTAGSISSDGRYLALEVSFSSTAYGALATQLEVAPMLSGRFVVVPHTVVGSGVVVGFGWPTGSDDLVAEFRFNERVQTLFWDHRTGGVSVADISPRQDPFGLVIG